MSDEKEEMQEFLNKMTKDWNDMWYEECAKGLRNNPINLHINLPRSFGKTFYHNKKVNDEQE